MKTGDQLSGWLRRRELASDRRAGQFSRRKAVERQYAWVQQNWLAVVALIAFIFAALPLVLLLPGWSRGLAAGAWSATGVCLVAFQVVLASGTAPQMMGERGEQLTASELRRLARRGWSVINHVALTRYGDIDHVVVGHGGVLVIETKWSGEPWTLDGRGDDRVRAAADRVSSDASRIRSLFPSQIKPSAVFPVVVLWGGHSADDVEKRVIDGVTVLRGTELRGWLGALEPRVLTSDQQAHAWQKLESTVLRRDAFDAVEDGPPPRTPGEWVRLIVGVMFASWLGLLASAASWSLWKSFPLFFAVEAVLLGIGLVVFRRTSYGPAAVAWLASVLGVAVLVAIVAAYSVL